ncbi:NaCP60E [Symbiodinium sp. CCMP2592]|nr:NaCP60E [Symbiodinium sp. CCMP2592]
MNSAQGLRKGLVEQWQAAVSATDKFAFLKAYLLDRDMQSIEIQPYFEELSESQNTEQFIELPLCEIKEKYEKLPGGDKFIADLISSQKGKDHPQSTDPNWKIYKVFNCVKKQETPDCILVLFACLTSDTFPICKSESRRDSQISRSGSKTKATIKPSQNAKERQALVDTLEAKVSSMGKNSVSADAKPKVKAKAQKELTADEKMNKDFQRDHMGLQKMVFACTPVEECIAALEEYKPTMAGGKIITDAEDIVDSHKRLAAEKRKREKEEKKKNNPDGEEMDDDACEEDDMQEDDMQTGGNAADDDWGEEEEPPAKRVRDYWADQDQQWCRDHPILTVSDWGDCVPLRLYGDGAEFTSSPFANTFCDMMCNDPLKLCLHSCPNREKLSCINMMYHNDDSRWAILEVLSWSMESLASGRYPTADPWGNVFSCSYEPARWKVAGEWLAGGKCGILDGFQADLEFIKKIFFLKRNSASLIVFAKPYKYSKP